MPGNLIQHTQQLSITFTPRLDLLLNLPEDLHTIEDYYFPSIIHAYRDSVSDQVVNDFWGHYSNLDENYSRQKFDIDLEVNKDRVLNYIAGKMKIPVDLASFVRQRIPGGKEMHITILTQGAYEAFVLSSSQVTTNSALNSYIRDCIKFFQEIYNYWDSTLEGGTKYKHDIFHLMSSTVKPACKIGLKELFKTISDSTTFGLLSFLMEPSRWANYICEGIVRPFAESSHYFQDKYGKNYSISQITAEDLITLFAGIPHSFWTGLRKNFGSDAMSLLLSKASISTDSVQKKIYNLPEGVTNTIYSFKSWLPTDFKIDLVPDSGEAIINKVKAVEFYQPIFDFIFRLPVLNKIPSSVKEFFKRVAAGYFNGGVLATSARIAADLDKVAEIPEDKLALLKAIEKVLDISIQEEEAEQNTLGWHFTEQELFGEFEIARAQEDL
jgi:hypothetical protein